MLNQPLSERPEGSEETVDALGIPLIGFPVEKRKRPKTGQWGQKPFWIEADSKKENYRVRVRQCEELGEYAMAEHIRQILVQEQDHQIALATALGKDVPDVTKADERA